MVIEIEVALEPLWEATPTTFIPSEHVKNPQTGPDTNGIGQSRELAARSQRGSSTKPSEDVEIQGCDSHTEQIKVSLPTASCPVPV